MGKNWENFGVESGEGQKQLWCDRRSKKVHFASLMYFCHLKNAVLQKNDQKYKGRDVLRGDIVEDDSGSYAVFTDKESSASQMTAVKVMDILQGYLDAQAKQQTQYRLTQVRMEDAPKMFKIPHSECADIWIRLPRHKWPKAWSSMEDPVVSSWTKIVWSSFGRTSGKGHLRKFSWSTSEKKVTNWECSLVHREKGLFLSGYVDDIKLAGQKQTLIRRGKYSIKWLIRENGHHFLIMWTWVALKDKVKQAKTWLTITEPC